MDKLWIRVFVTTGALIISVNGGLTCHYCYHADHRADCRINTVQCDPFHVCYVEESAVTYTQKSTGKQRDMQVYRMGCEHFSLCRDQTVSGPGPYGYSLTSTFCCCQPLCEEPDGVGEGNFDVCPFLWQNATTHGTAMVWVPHCTLLLTSLVTEVLFRH